MPRRKNLKGIASGIAGSFVSRNNDVGGYWGVGKLCILARNLGISIISVNLVDGDELAQSSEPVVPSIAEHYGAMLQRMLSRAGMNPLWVKRAEVTIEFGTSGHLPIPPLYTRGNPFLCTCTIIDDREHEWIVSVTGRCEPHDPSKETKSARVTGLPGRMRPKETT